MTSSTRPVLHWQTTADAIYLRGPSPKPWPEHGGPLHGYAIRQPDGTWKVRDLAATPKQTTTVADRAAARAELERISAVHLASIGAAPREAA